jgi:hypothetical protein
MQRQLARRGRLIATVVLLSAFLGSTWATAQQSDPGLQGRILQRSDGSVYLYKDGLKYPIQLIAMSDEDLDAVPDGGGISRLDEFFTAPAQPTPAEQPESASPTPMPAPGTILYQANWSSDLSAWSAASQSWKSSAGMLLNDGTDRSQITAPYVVASPDYAVEAEIRAIKWHVGNPTFFSITVRGDNSAGDSVGYYASSVYYDGQHVSYARLSYPSPAVFPELKSVVFDPGESAHLYRVELRGNHLRYVIDGAEYLSLDDNRYLRGGAVGLYSGGAQIEVRSFKVIVL